MADTSSCDYDEIVDINLWGVPVSSIKIRNLDDGFKASLRIRAARHGLSMEQEVRNILQIPLLRMPTLRVDWRLHSASISVLKVWVAMTYPCLSGHPHAPYPT
jgi:hypothetical protein